MTQTEPLISVILPLDDHRDQYRESLQSFLHQSLGDAEVEVVVPCSDTDPDVEREIAQRYPGARMIRGAGLNLHELYNLGASQATGQYLYLSEMHCVADPACLAAALECAEREQFDCVCSQSTGIDRNSLAALEQKIFESDFSKWKRDTRGKITIRGCLLRRDVWAQTGGFRTEFGHYAEVMLGRELQAAGQRFGYAERSLVAHCNQIDFQELIASLLQYGYDECRSNHLAPPAESELCCKEWSQYRGRKSQRALRTLRLRLVSFCFLALVKYCPARFGWHFRAYKKLWGATIKIGRLNYLRELETAESIPYVSQPTQLSFR